MSLQYRAFLSYSHKDTAFARTLHKSLENWKIAPDLVGKETTAGVVPAKLRPIFRDRDDFASGASLKVATLAALEQSEFLIVICSPNSAASQYVDAEVRVFKKLGRAHRIIPIIIAGEPGSVDTECFPPSVAYELDQDGDLTDIPVEPIAADAREEGDGRHRATAKIVAGLLGLSFDEIARREEKVQRQRIRMISCAAIVMTVLAILSGYLAWLADARRLDAQRNYQAARSAADSLLGDIGGELIAIDDYPDTKKRLVLARAEAIYDQLLETTGQDISILASRAEAQLVFAVAFESSHGLANSFHAAIKAQKGFSELIELQPDVAQWWTRRAIARLLTLFSVHQASDGDLVDAEHPDIIRRKAMADIGQARQLGGADDELHFAQGRLNLYEAVARFAYKDYDRSIDFLTIAMQNLDAIKSRNVQVSWSDGRDMRRHVYNQIAEVHIARGASKDALAARFEEIRYIEARIADDPADNGPHEDLHSAYQSVAILALDLELYADAASAQQKAALANFSPEMLWSNDPDRLAEVAALAFEYGESAANTLDFAEQRANAIQWYFITAALYDRLFSLKELDVDQSLEMMRSLNQLEWLHFETLPEREVAARSALVFARRLAARWPEQRIALGHALIDMAEVYSSTDRSSVALPLYQEAAEILATAPHASFPPSNPIDRHAFALMRMAMVHSLAGDNETAKGFVENAIEILEANIKAHPTLREPLVVAISQVAPHLEMPEVHWRRIIELLSTGDAPSDAETPIKKLAERALTANE